MSNPSLPRDKSIIAPLGIVQNTFTSGEPSNIHYIKVINPPVVDIVRALQIMVKLSSNVKYQKKNHESNLN